MIWESSWRWAVIYFIGPIALSLLTRGSAPDFTRHLGMGSASAIVAVGPDHFLAASDEDKRLRLYPFTNGPSLMEFDVSPWLRLGGRHGEVDLASATARTGYNPPLRVVGRRGQRHLPGAWGKGSSRPLASTTARAGYDPSLGVVGRFTKFWGFPSVC